MPTPIGIGIQSQILRMRSQAGIELPKRMVGIAGPALIGRGGDHAGAYRIEFDVALAGKKISFGFDEAGLVAIFPQGATAPVGVIDVTYVASPNGLHHIANRRFDIGCHQQMHVVGHQHAGVNRAGIFLAGFLEAVEIATEIFLGKEARFPVIAPLDDMLRHAGQREAGLASHASFSLVLWQETQQNRI
jgi:hypothetical protein